MNTEPKQQKAVVRRKRARPTESARQPEQVTDSNQASICISLEEEDVFCTRCYIKQLVLVN